MPNSDVLDDGSLLRRAALEAGRIALGFLHDRTSNAVWEKSPGHPVSDADLAVNTYLERFLRTARPDYGWLSEETADDPDRLSRQRVFVVDPIDGTRAFLRGDPHWCVGLAVVEAGRPISSAIFAPVFNEIFEARLGEGAFRNGVSIRASSESQEPGCRLIASRDLIEHKAWREPWPNPVLAQPKPNATLYRLAKVATGTWDGTLALWRKSDWDLAPGTLLIEEAGGVASTHLGEPFQFNREVPAQRSLVAAGRGLHPLLVERTKQLELPDPLNKVRAGNT